MVRITTHQMHQFLKLLLLIWCCDSETSTRQIGNYICVYDDSSTYTWYMALYYCEIVYGTSLASIHSSTDETAAELSRYSTSSEAWIGFTDADAESVWLWIDGTPVNYNISWNPGEPNDYYGAEDCATFLSSSTLFNDISCSTNYHQFICNAPTAAPTDEPSPRPTAEPSPTPTNRPTGSPIDTLISTSNPTHSSRVTSLITTGSGSGSGGMVNGNGKSGDGNDDIAQESLFVPFIIVCVLFGICCLGIIGVIMYYFLCHKRMKKLEFEILRSGQNDQLAIEQVGNDNNNDNDNDDDEVHVTAAVANPQVISIMKKHDKNANKGTMAYALAAEGE